MRFLHMADVHLGAEPEAGRAYTAGRGREIWESFERALHVCEEKEIDLLLIAGDLFHRQPLLRELKDVDYLFGQLSHTKVVLIVGNHDYLKTTSFYRTFHWSDNVYPILNTELSYVEFPELDTCVYGLSYDRKEIPERLLDGASRKDRRPIEILLAHGGDEKHIPLRREKLQRSGFDYIALGHIHRPGEIVQNQVYYAGSLEPTDKNDLGKHGFILGEITRERRKIRFVPFAVREYIHMDVEVTEDMSGLEIRDRAVRRIEELGKENIYQITLTGSRDPRLTLNPEELDPFGNVVAVTDATQPAYDLGRLMRQNEENLLGRYIAAFDGCERGSLEELALQEGLRALMETRS